MEEVKKQIESGQIQDSKTIIGLWALEQLTVDSRQKKSLDELLIEHTCTTVGGASNPYISRQ